LTAPNELIFRGERINPVKLRVSELSWPVETGMSMAYRTPAGEWIDLTDYLVFESGQTTLTVGGYDRSLTNPSGRQEALGSRAAPNTSIPDTPEFLQPFTQAVYQSTGTGISKAQIQVRWLVPDNTDGTAVIDGDHYEIRYRTQDGADYRRPAGAPEDVPVYPTSSLYPGTASYPGETTVGGSAAVIPPGTPSTWAQAAGRTWAELDTWAQPLVYLAGPWNVSYAQWDTTQLLIQELTPGVPYQFEIRAVDNAVPPNVSPWSDSVLVNMVLDTIPPPTPAPPEVASSLIAVQITHLLGAASGGTFNLPADMHHFEVHAEHEPTFVCSQATMIGKILANNGMIISQTPVVSTLQVASTEDMFFKVVAVDEAGNRSTPSAPVQASADLIDDAHISDLTVSKVTAGTVTANWVQAAEFATAPDGVRAGMDHAGLFAINALGNRNWEVAAESGDMVSYTPVGAPTMRIQASTGNVYLYKSDGVTPAMRLLASSGQLEINGKLTAGDGIGVGPTIVVDPTSGSPSINFYPSASLDRFTMRVADDDRPDGTSGAALKLQAVDGVTGDPEGFAINAWDANVWIGQRDVTGWRSLLVMQGDGLVQLEGGPGNEDSVRPNLHFDAAGAVLEAPGQQVIIRANEVSGNYLLLTPTSAQLVENGVPKAFTIDHPLDPDRWLVHSCTESPTAGIEYTGECVIIDGHAVVELPGYFEALAEPVGRTVQLTPVAELCLVAADPILAGRFQVRCDGPDGTRVAWHVRATRVGAAFDPEPRRDAIRVNRFGPYSWVTPLPEEN
jgi:hypothetical protein